MGYTYLIGHITNDLIEKGFGLAYIATSKLEGLDALKSAKLVNGSGKRWVLLKVPNNQITYDLLQYIIKEI
jgi:hypothetical protein